ncbi:MAG: hypothetical protein ABEJ74_04110 [Haloferacaceae archaeon]
MSEDRDRSEHELGRDQHERAEVVEHIVREVESELDDPKYPVQSDELAEEYATQPIDAVNETETLGDVFDRVGEKFDSRQEVREALYAEITGEAAGPEEYNPERDVDALEAELDEEDPLDEP